MKRLQTTKDALKDVTIASIKVDPPISKVIEANPHIPNDTISPNIVHAYSISPSESSASSNELSNRPEKMNNKRHRKKSKKKNKKRKLNKKSRDSDDNR